jgi:cytochrome P450
MTQGADAWIVKKVGDVARPRAAIRVARELDHVPGESGLWNGMKTIFGMFNEGYAFFLRQRGEFGDVIRTQFGFDPIVCVFDPELVSKILVNQDGAWSAALGWRTLFDRIDTTSDTMDMLVGLDFAPHKDARKLMQPAFSHAAVTGYIEAATDEFAKALPTWRGTVAFKPAVRRVFAGVAGRIFMGVDDPKDVAMIDRSMALFWAASMAPIKKRLVSRAWRQGLHGYRMLFEHLRALVPERRRGPERNDLFTRLCKLPKDVDWIDDATLVRLFMSIMIAAFDTTSFAVSSMAYLLARHPEWQERLREESRRVSDDRVGRDHLAELEQMEWVWKETLRVFPVAPDAPRRTLRTVKLGEHELPAGTMTLPMLGPLLQHPKWWQKPDVFDPERFSPARAEHKQHRAIYLPFGAGAHACIGAQLAEVEAKVFFHQLLSKVRFRLADDQKVRHQFRPLGQVSGPVRLVFENA